MSQSNAYTVMSMSYDVFSELLTNSKGVRKSIEKADKIMEIVGREIPSDNRNNMNSTLRHDIAKKMIESKESLLVAKIVDLSILFAGQKDNPHYFEEVCEVFTNEEKTGKKVNYQRIASAFNTTEENVKANMLLVETKKTLTKTNVPTR